MAQRPTAYPELIRPGEWTVKEWKPTDGHAPCASSGAKVMIVPAGPSQHARDIRFHELLHVKHSPATVPNMPDVSQDSLLAAEDCRVNLLGSLIRSHDALGTERFHDPFTLLTSKTALGMARLAAACIGYASSPRWFEHVMDGLAKLASATMVPAHMREHAETLRDVIQEVWDCAPEYFTHNRRVDPGVATFDATINLARWLDTFGDSVPVPSKDPKPDGEYDDAADGEGGDAKAGKEQWGKMKIETPPLVVNTQRATAIGRRTTPCTAGTKMVHFSRLVTGEVFGRPRKRTIPDAVLIDQSGSMHWDSDKLAELVSKMPVGIVAGYAGQYGEGTLRILAKDGRMVAAEKVAHEFGGNEIDGPALRWLATQPGRKVWVSDEGVCSDEGNAEDLAADVATILKPNGIKVCLSTDPATILKTLRGK